MLIAQGAADTLVVPSATRLFVSQACAAGDRVTYREYPDATHATIANDAVPALIAFLAGAPPSSPPTSSC